MDSVVRKEHGWIKFFSQEKGFGFVSGIAGIEYYFHVSNILCDPSFLKPKKQVRFLKRPSTRKPDQMEAFDLELIGLAGKAFSDAVIRHKQISQDPTPWLEWSDPKIQSEYTELKSDFDLIERYSGLKYAQMHQSEILGFFEYPLPPGAFPADHDGKDRNGIVAVFRDDVVALVVHAFKNNSDETDYYWCWRAAIRNEQTNKLVGLISKRNDYSGKLEKRNFYRKLTNLLGDIPEMIRIAKDGYFDPQNNE